MPAEEIIAFGQKFDPQAFHTDPVAAQGTLFGRLVASGWHTAAVSMQLMVLGEMALDGGVIGQGMENLRWPRPVLPGERQRVGSASGVMAVACHDRWRRPASTRACRSTHAARIALRCQFILPARGRGRSGGHPGSVAVRFIEFLE